MNVTMKDIIISFMLGASEGISGSKSSPGNLAIKENEIIHFSTPILERYGSKYIHNMTRYSIQTGRLQKLIKELVTSESIIVVLKVPMHYKGELVEFLEKQV